MRKLLLATKNEGKLREYRCLLDSLGYQLVSPKELGINIEVAETGSTMAENAILKATTFARESNLLTLSDDSGLEVDALGGQPGVLSARYASENASQKELINYLLSKLKDVPEKERSARFRCIIAIATPSGEVKTCSGECPGFITFKAAGSHGFGYDPVFYLPQHKETMAQLTMTEKNRISHRARAAAGARKILESIRG
jgi:XTP/dITP diphosphohydrolase